MIKGINKQIIEIRCTNDEYFDKVLLFVRADKSGSSSSLLNRKAINFCGRVLPSSFESPKHGKLKLFLLALLIISVISLAAYALVMV